MGPEPPGASGLRGCWKDSVYWEMRTGVRRLCSKGVSEMIWLFEGTVPLSDTTGSSSTVSITVSRNFGTTEESGSFAAVRSGCALSRIDHSKSSFPPDFLPFSCEFKRIKKADLPNNLKRSKTFVSVQTSVLIPFPTLGRYGRRVRGLKNVIFSGGLDGKYSQTSKRPCLLVGPCLAPFAIISLCGDTQANVQNPADVR